MITIKFLKKFLEKNKGKLDDEQVIFVIADSTHCNSHRIAVRFLEVDHKRLILEI